MPTILLVDDDPFILELCRDVLEPAGYATVCLTDGDQLEARVAAARPDLVVLDIMLPGSDGLSLCQRLRTNSGFRGPIVIHSAKRYDADRALASQVGATAFLSKPCPPQRLLELVQDLLSRALRVRFWGVRGSIPTPSRDTVAYGGNTPCVEVRASGIEDIFILDGGTGLRDLGRALQAERPAAAGYLCFSHYHWDHIQGLPFFEPAYRAGNRFTLVGPAQPTADLLQILSGQMASVYFPVGLEQLGAHLAFKEIDEGTFTLGGVEFATLSSVHPGRALMYRVSHGDKRVVYATDNEVARDWHTLGEEGKHQVTRFLRFFDGADLLIHDAQFTPEESAHRRGWGHSAWPDVVDLAVAARVKHCVLFHHDPDHSDAFLDGLLVSAQQRIAAAGSTLVCTVAREGECLTL